MDAGEFHLFHSVTGRICKYPVERQQQGKGSAEVMKLTAGDLYELGMVEHVFLEPSHYTVQNLKEVTREMDERSGEFIGQYGALTAEEISERRYQRFRQM